MNTVSLPTPDRVTSLCRPKHWCSWIPRVCVCIACLLIAGTANLRAASGIWIGDVDNLWSDTASWLGGAVADGAGDTATFSNNFATVTVNLDSPRTVGMLEFVQGYYTITNNNVDSNILTLDGAAKPVIYVSPSSTPVTLRSVVLAGNNGFVLDGGGQLNIYKGGTIAIPADPPNLVSGSVILSNGTLQVQGDDVTQDTDPNANDPALDGIESFTFYNGSTLNMVPDPSTTPSYGSVQANWIVPEGQFGTLVLPPRWSGTGETGGSGMDGTLTGGGILNLQVRYLRGNIGGDWSAFTGQINVSGAAGTDSQWRFGNAAGFPNAAVHLTGTAPINARYYPAPGGEVEIPIGALSSDNAQASLNGGNGGTTMVTFRIGALRTNATDVDMFLGALWNNTGMRLVKEGAGTWVLAGNSDHSGGTTISSGVLQVGDGFSEVGSLGTGPVTNSAALVFARGGTLHVAGAVTGSGSVTNLGPGSVILAGANDYTGPTHVTAGEVELYSGSQLPGSVNVAGGAALGARVASAGGTVGLGGLAFGSGSTFNVDLGTFGNATSPVVSSSGVLIMNGSVTVNLDGAGVGPGTMTLLEYGSRSGAGTFVLGGLPTGVTVATLNDDTVNKRLTLTVTTVFDPTLRWVGGAVGDWDIGNTANQVWRVVGSGQLTNYFDGAMVRFDDTATGTTAVNLTAYLSPGSVLVDNSAKEYTFGGFGTLGGPTVLTKQGSGRLTLNTANDYTGGTLINGGTLRIGDGTTAATLAAAPAITNNATLTFNSLSDNLVSGVISGSGLVVQDGPGILTLSGANTHTGGTLVRSNSIFINNNGSAVGGAGATLTLDSGILQMPVDVWSGRQVVVLSDSGVTSTGNRRIDSPIIGTNVTLSITNAALMTLTADLNGFHGTLELASLAGQTLRFNAGGANSCAGSSNTLFYFNPPEGQTNWLVNRNGGVIDLGAIAGGPGRIDQGGSAISAILTYVIGALNLDTTFTGYIVDSSRTTAITKVGTGTLTLNNVGLEHKGAVTINDGVLAFTGITVNSPSNTSVVVNAPGILDLSGANVKTLTLGAGTASQVLAGNGTIRGSVVLGANAQVEPGQAGSIGVLTVTNAVTLGGTTTMELNRANAPAPTSDGLAAASFAGSTLLTVVNIGPTDFVAGDTFQLFSGPVSGITLAGALPELPCANLSWTNKLAVDGSLAVIGTSCLNLTPTNIMAVLVDGKLDLSWPADQTGWTLQSNAVDVANATMWFPVQDPAITNRVIITPEPTEANVFFRLVAP